MNSELAGGNSRMHVPGHGIRTLSIATALGFIVSFTAVLALWRLQRAGALGNNAIWARIQQEQETTRDQIGKLATQLDEARTEIRRLEASIDSIRRERESMNLTDYGDPYVPSGWMGDGVDGMFFVRPRLWYKSFHSPPSSTRIVYLPGTRGWAGIYWQNKVNNWGDRPGDDLSEAHFAKLTVWARGELGGEQVEFKAGGIRNSYYPYQDSFEVTTGRLQLGKEWQKYEIDLKGKDLSSVIGAFAFVVTKGRDGKEVVFYFDDIQYEK